MLFGSNVCFFIEEKSVESYDQRKLKCIKRRQKKNINSIYNMSFELLKEFISKLNGKSYFIFASTYDRQWSIL